MESLRFFIKENKMIVLLYGTCILIGIALLIYDIFRILNGDIDKTILRFLFRSVLLVPALLFYLKDFKKLVSVYRDYKTQKTETKILYVRNTDFKNCKDEFNGVYNILYCAENQNDKCKEYWLYRKSQIYDDIVNGRKYRVTYYANSKCLCTIESISNNTKVKKQKLNTNNIKVVQNNIQKKIETTDPETEKNKLWVLTAYIFGICTLPFSVYALIQLWQTKNIIDNFYLLFCIVCILVFILYSLLIYKFVNSILLHSKTPKIVVEQFITIGIPVMQLSKNTSKHTFYLKVQNEKGKKKDLFFYTTDILGLGDLNERPGYLGYGDFIGMKYEIEYYKVSKVIKSMRLIDEQSNDV